MLTELAALTPGEYIHIGGDESHSTKKADYIIFMNKVQILSPLLGKKAIGWDEIATANLLPGTGSNNGPRLPMPNWPLNKMHVSFFLLLPMHTSICNTIRPRR